MAKREMYLTSSLNVEQVDPESPEKVLKKVSMVGVPNEGGILTMVEGRLTSIVVIDKARAAKELKKEFTAEQLKAMPSLRPVLVKDPNSSEALQDDAEAICQTLIAALPARTLRNVFGELLVYMSDDPNLPQETKATVSMAVMAIDSSGRLANKLK